MLGQLCVTQTDELSKKCPGKRTLRPKLLLICTNKTSKISPSKGLANSVEICPKTLDIISDYEAKLVRYDVQNNAGIALKSCLFSSPQHLCL